MVFYSPHSGFGFGVQGLGLISEHLVYLKVQIPHGPYCMLGTYGRVGVGDASVSMKGLLAL